MKESQLKELIKEEYHNVKSFMEEKYGFVPELGQVVSNPYANAFVNEATEPEIISQLKDIVAKKQNQKLKDPKSGKRMTVDLYSASAVTQVYDALKQQKNKDKFVAQGLVGMVNLAFKLLKKESVDEGVWSKSALDKFNRKPMPGRYFISDENGNILEKGLKTRRSWVTYLHRFGKASYGYLGGQKPKVVNIHDGKKNNEVVDQYYWVEKYGKGNYSIDIDNPTAGKHGTIDPKLVNYKEIENQLGIKKESIEEYDVETIEETKDFINFMKEYKTDVNEAEYQGRDVKLGKIMQGDVKKFKVYVKNPKGNVVKVNFGHKGKGGEKTMRIKKSDPERRKAFRARHNCDNPGPRHKARYWACRTW